MLATPTPAAEDRMLYAIICYNNEAEISDWSPEEDAERIGRLIEVQHGWAEQGRLGPVVRLDFTPSATTLRKSQGGPPVVVDGPFAETKEALLGIYILDCATMEEAIEAAKELARANPDNGSYEIRPVRTYRPAPANSPEGVSQ